MPTQQRSTMPKDVTRRFWLTVKTPADAKPGVYRGTIDDPSRRQGGAAQVPVEFRVRNGHARPGGRPGRPVGLHDRDSLARRRSAAAAFNRRRR